MQRLIGGVLGAMAVLVAVAGPAAAGANVTVTREENKPANVEIKAGEEVAWTNATGGVAHIAFVGSEAVQIHVGGKEGGRIRFEKPGTYAYVVHVTGVKAHAHRGTVGVK